jgi:murein DD-endopeptidase MepM/ murein hydrolase activator NlpD
MNVAERSIIALVLCLSIVIPFSVHAGLLDVFLHTVAAKTPDPITYISSESAQDVPLLKAPLHADPNPAKGGGDIITLDGALVPSGDADSKEEKVNTKTANGEISLYVVREGDTLSEIASMYDVSAKTILWANDITNAAKIRPGDTLIILPITGVRHIVKAGDTPSSLAKKYSSDADEILSYNQIASTDGLTVGETIIIPDGTIAAPAVPKTSPARGAGAVASGGGSGNFVHPVPGAVRSQGIHGYNGVDLAAPAGTAVRAAAAGQVIVARGSGWNGGYGLYVVIKHANGTQTLYAHLSSLSVSSGDSVVAGQTIGGVGNTGRSTGNHLHFEVRGARNPF